mgnify:CR=1 FL=1
MSTKNKRLIVTMALVTVIIGGALLIPRKVEINNVADQIKIEHANIIDTFFTKRKSPLAGLGIKFVEEAEKNNLDWKLLPAISIIESSGGIQACGFNPFGWGSCKMYNFSSWEEAIETVALNLGGNNPNTAYYYKDKNIIEKLQAYNPPTISPNYVDKVLSIMELIK